MEKKLLICGIILLVLAAFSFGLSIIFHWVYKTIVDAPEDLRGRFYRRYLVFLFVGIGFAVSGVLLIVVRLVL